MFEMMFSDTAGKAKRPWSIYSFQVYLQTATHPLVSREKVTMMLQEPRALAALVNPLSYIDKETSCCIMIMWNLDEFRRNCSFIVLICCCYSLILEVL